VDAEGASEQIDFEGIDVPIEPVIGTIGVATAEGSVSTLTPDDHGGNLDTTDMTTGTTAYFPVFQEGAMLAMGDSKAAMADGEMCGTGAGSAPDRRDPLGDRGSGDLARSPSCRHRRRSQNDRERRDDGKPSNSRIAMSSGYWHTNTASPGRRRTCSPVSSAASK